MAHTCGMRSKRALLRTLKPGSALAEPCWKGPLLQNARTPWNTMHCPCLSGHVLETKAPWRRCIGVMVHRYLSTEQAREYVWSKRAAAVLCIREVTNHTVTNIRFSKMFNRCDAWPVLAATNHVSVVLSTWLQGATPMDTPHPRNNWPHFVGISIHPTVSCCCEEQGHRSSLDGFDCQAHHLP